MKKTKVKKITLPWVTMIRKRLKEKDSRFGTTFKQHVSVWEFIKPILEYGEAEEKRITKGFEKKVYPVITPLKTGEVK